MKKFVLTIACLVLLVGCNSAPAPSTTESVEPSSKSMPSSESLPVPALGDAEKRPYATAANDFSIEIEDAKGEKHILTSADLYYRFYYKVQASGVLVYSWEHPSKIDAHYLVNFFEAQANWNQTSYDSEIVYLPQEIVENYIKMYFDVESEQIRQSKMYYLPELESYQIPMYSLEYPCKITNATSEGKLLTIYYETYSNFKEDLPILRQGYVTIEVELYPVRWKYISNTITYDAEKQ